MRGEQGDNKAAGGLDELDEMRQENQL